MKVIDSTDKKHIGESVEIIDNKIVFQNGETMSVEKIAAYGTQKVISNSNYILIVEVTNG